MAPRSITWIDGDGNVWEFTPPDPTPVLVGNVYSGCNVDPGKLELTEADRQWLADLKVTE